MSAEEIKASPTPVPRADTPSAAPAPSSPAKDAGAAAQAGTPVPSPTAQGASKPGSSPGAGTGSRSAMETKEVPSSTYTAPVEKSKTKGAAASPELAPDPPLRWPSPRAPLGMLLVLVLMAGVLYPGAITLLANEVAPVSPTYVSTLLGENISNPALFWERPSQIDWIPVWNDSLDNGAGDEAPQYPTNPALINQTLSYIYQYGLENATVPLDLVSPSASGLDPDIYPDAALIQVPRICAEVCAQTGLHLSTIWGLVNDSITPPVAGFIGPSYVNVVSLDQSLLALPQMVGTTPGGTGVGN